MSDSDIDFLMDDDHNDQQQQQQASATMNFEKNNLIGGDDDDDDEGAFDGYLAGENHHEEEEEEEEEEANDDDEYLYKNLDDGEWTEDDVKVLLAKVEQLRDRFKKISSKIIAHPLVWVPLNASSSAVANDAKSVLQQQQHGSIYFVNGLAKISHRIDTETKLLNKHLETGQYSRAKCNNLAFLEIFVRVLEIERGILFVSVTLPLRAKKSERLKADNSIEMDLVSRGGLRWVKIRGSSARNLESDVVVDFDDDDDEDEDNNNNNNNNDENGNENINNKQKHVTTPFTQLLARVSRCATLDSTSLRLPFKSTPEAIMVCSDTPTPKTVSTIKKHAPNLKLLDNNKLAKLQHGLPPIDYNIECINFDVTAMVAMCSDITNNADPQNQMHSKAFPSNPVLQRQADQERNGQLCIENFLAPVLAEFSEVVSKSSSCSSSSTSSSRVSERVRNMMMGKNGLEVVMARAELGAKFWRPLLLDEYQKLHPELFEGIDDDEEAHEAVLSKISNETLVKEIDGIAPRLEIEKPGALFGIISHNNKNHQKNDSSNNHMNLPTNWIAAKGAIEEFAWIVETISGPTERLRAVWLLKRINSIDTDQQPGIHDRLKDTFARAVAAATAASEDTEPKYNPNGKKVNSTARSPTTPDNAPTNIALPVNVFNVKQRQLNVFSLGDATASVTLSANKAFLHSAFECGQLLCCSTHPARALTERKRLGKDTKPGRDQWRAGNRPLNEKDKF